GRSWSRRHKRGADECCAVEVPEGNLACARVLKRKVSFAVAVQIAAAGDTPARRGNGRYVDAAEKSPTVQIPERHLVGRVVLQDQVVLVVAVEIAGADNMPARA